MTERAKIPSFRALNELKTIAIEWCKKAYHDHSYGDSFDTPRTEEVCGLDTAKKLILKRISREIEEYAVRQYKNYGIKIVLVCNRSNISGDNRLNVQLEVQQYPELIKQQELVDKVITEYRAARESVDTWYYDALKAIAQREALPEIPEFKVRK